LRFRATFGGRAELKPEAQSSTGVLAERALAWLSCALLNKISPGSGYWDLKNTEIHTFLQFLKFDRLMLN
jgi:hypothetical protein